MRSTMPRTRQTASKSTGADAPSKPFPFEVQPIETASSRPTTRSLVQQSRANRVVAAQPACAASSDSEDVCQALTTEVGVSKDLGTLRTGLTALRCSSAVFVRMQAPWLSVPFATVLSTLR